MKVETAQAMQDLGARIAQVAQPGDALILTGELGAGKTTFAQGVARGMQITEHVTSPTFVMSKHYPSETQGLDLFHLDVYRMTTADELLDLWSESDAQHGFTLVEWGAPWVSEFGASVAEMIIDSERNIDFIGHTEKGRDLITRIQRQETAGR